MSFDKHYPNRKDWRKPYTRSGRFDRTCRPGGSCPWCQSNRTHKDVRVIPADIREQLEQARVVA